MNVSIIIPTYNRGKKLLNVLESLAIQKFKHFEVVIVNDGSTDDTKEILDNDLKKFSLNIQVIHQENGGRSKVRNRGAALAKDGLLIFMDDDMRHNEDAIQLHVDHHLQMPNSILVGNQIEDLQLATTDFHRYKVHISNIWSNSLSRHKGALNQHNLHTTAANFSISKKIFWDINGFDEHLTDAEDYDLAMRAFVAGIPIYFDPNIIGWHDDFMSCNSFVNRRRRYTKSHQFLQGLKPDLYSQFHRRVEGSTSLFKKIIYNVFKGQGWISLIDSGYLALLPREFRYKLYSAVIYANSKIG